MPRKHWYRVPYALPGGGYTCVQALNPADAKEQAARYCGWPVRYFGAPVLTDSP